VGQGVSLALFLGKGILRVWLWKAVHGCAKKTGEKNGNLRIETGRAGRK
jgi:hypothetical protein